MQTLSVRARRLAHELKARREAAGLTVEEAAAQLGWSYSKLNRFEIARAIPSPADVGHMLDLYDAEANDREDLIKLARDAKERGWWEGWKGIWRGSYVALEDGATAIRTWETQLVPGLLQIDSYARSVIQAGLPGHDRADIDRRVQARMARKTLLSREESPQFEAIMDEAVLRRPIGGRTVMREQLHALLAGGQRPSIAVRVLPFTSGDHAGLDGSFTILEFGDRDPAVTFTEDLTGERYVEDADGNRRIRFRYDLISEKALSAEDSAALIAEYAKE